MAHVQFARDTVWPLVQNSVSPDAAGFIGDRMGFDPITGRSALLLIDGASLAGPPHSTILLLSPSLAEATKTKAMKAAMKKAVTIAFALTAVSFYSKVLVLGGDFSDGELLKVQNNGATVTKVTLGDLAGN